jgi:hypothetical protein
MDGLVHGLDLGGRGAAAFAHTVTVRSNGIWRGYRRPDCH